MSAALPFSLDVDCGDGTQMGLYVARPAGAAKAGVLVFQEIWGVNPHIRSVADRLAELGYLAAAPDLFHRTAPGYQNTYANNQEGRRHAMAITPASGAADIVAAHAWLTGALPTGAPIAAVGFCMGGRFAFSANALVPLAATVPFYGGGIHGVLDQAPAQHGPALFFWGGQDQFITAEHRRATIDAMHAAGKPFTAVLYDHVDHGFFCDERASYHAGAARGAWAQVAVFLADHLGGAPA